MKGTLNYTIRIIKGSRASIQIVHRFGRRNEVRYSTGHIIMSKDNWDMGKQRVRSIIAETNASKINQFLDKKAHLIGKELSSLFFDNPNYTKADVINLLDRVFEKSHKTENKTPTLIEAYDWYIDYFAINPNPTTLRPLSNGTIRSFKTSKRIFKKYSKTQGGLDYEDITMDFYKDFLTYLRGLKHSNNYIANHIKNLKTILNFSFSRGYHTNTTYKRREFAKPFENVDAIFLNLEELKAIENLNLPKGQDVSRDLFLIGAHTGLRVSDFNNLKKENIKSIDGRYYIEIESKKTKTRLLIPCNSTTLKIIKKYDYAPPPQKKEQNINRDLKIIGEKAEIIDEIVISKTIAGKIKKEPFFKYQLISTHTARRSFCTNAYTAGMPTLDIMTISGHQTEKVFYNYIKATSLEKAKKIAEHSFFNI